MFVRSRSLVSSALTAAVLLSSIVKEKESKSKHVNFKKILMTPTCVWCIVCGSINRPGDLDL